MQESEMIFFVLLISCQVNYLEATLLKFIYNDMIDVILNNIRNKVKAKLYGSE